MEKISTPRAALLPRAADLATLAVVVAATLWSGAQRPASPAMLSAAPIDTPAQQQQPAVLTSSPGAAISGEAVAKPTWPAQTVTTPTREGLQAVGYQTRAQR